METWTHRWTDGIQKSAQSKSNIYWKKKVPFFLHCILFLLVCWCFSCKNCIHVRSGCCFSWKSRKVQFWGVSHFPHPTPQPTTSIMPLLEAFVCPYRWASNAHTGNCWISWLRQCFECRLHVTACVVTCVFPPAHINICTWASTNKQHGYNKHGKGMTN